tara:strand:+ start:930 stop:1265 length:336 start_codon:yes stop_codon:yes gene_type:complete
VTEISDWLQAELRKGDPPVPTADLGFKQSDCFYAADSLRLRSAGFKLMRIFFDCEEFQHDRGFNAGEIISISKYMNTPFYINRNKIVLFSNENIVMCKMAGSVALWLNNFS